MAPIGCLDTFKGLFVSSKETLVVPASTVRAPLAIVDMGSNGIRFGIIASLDRHLPVLYEERASISLFAAQFSDRQPISEKVIDEVVRMFERWAALCQQANVQRVRVIATEATRTAPNSEYFQGRIKEATGWTVELLSKAQEANIGALGVMASYHKIEGLFMDLGGGSVQLNYISRDPARDSQGKSSPNAQSWPYGAAALSRRLNNCGQDQAARQAIYEEMVQAFKKGLNDINIPEEIRAQNERLGGYRLYLSGGGFRALGYLMMVKKMKNDKGGKHDDGHRYPIPIINGLVSTGKELAKIVEEYRFLAPEEVKTSFRVSKRRAKLIPACATLMAAVMEVIPISEVMFSEGGASGGGQPPLSDSDVESLTAFVLSAIPEDFAECCPFVDSIPRLVPLLVMVMNCYNQLPKEARSTAAWQLFLPGGALANCYGLTHSDRAILATALAERHEGDLADPDTGDAVKKLIPGGKVARQAVKYLGRILGLAAVCSPLPNLATHLLSTNTVPHKKRGHLSFVHKPHPSGPSKDNGKKHKHRSRDANRTRVGGDESSSSSSSSSSDESDNEPRRGGKDRKGKDHHRKLILKIGTLPSGAAAHGQVKVRIQKSHALLVAPTVEEAVEELAKAAQKTQGFTDFDEGGSSGKKGKGVSQA
ncbi:Ppx/GppA phosphatase family-domain-containing protein [Mortierella sp. GBAus27b]|nr:Ppx/GppA phosphatase family-domain-containing protein [Mortierella sp. GBAus27b]